MLHWGLTREQELREIHAAWIQQNGGEEEERGPEGPQGEVGGTAGVSAEADTPLAFTPQDLPAATIGIEPPPLHLPKYRILFHLQ